MSGNQPFVDRLRRSLFVPKRLMPSLLAAHAGRVSATPAFAELETAGMISAHRLDPMVGELIDIVTNSTLVITVDVDVSGSPHPGLATFWKSDDLAVVGHSNGEDSFELMAVEASLLPFHLAQIVHLVPRRRPVYKGSFTVPAQTLITVDSMATLQPRRAEHELAAAGVAPEWTDRILATLIMRRALWTVESIWLGDHRSREEARLVVLDGGFAGYWRLSERHGVVTVKPVGFDELMRLLEALLPNRSNG